MNNLEIKIPYLRKVVDGGMEMVNRGLTVGTWGNISVRDPETNLFYIKPSANGLQRNYSGRCRCYEQ